MPASNTSLPAVPCFTHTNKHTPKSTNSCTDCINVLDRVLQNQYNQDWENHSNLMMGATKFDFITCYGFKCKAIFLHFFFLHFFLTSALSGTCCYKSRVGFFPTVGLKGGNKEEEKGKEGLPLLFALLVCACVYANGRADVYVHIGCKRMYEQPF